MTEFKLDLNGPPLLPESLEECHRRRRSRWGVCVGSGGRRPRQLEAGYDIRTVQELLGHADVSITMIYIHVLNKPALPPVVSPADF